jgi:hypothetical protein
MESDAYKLGHLDAAIEFGLTKEAWGKAVLPVLSSLAGAALAPEGEGAQGALLGGLGALGLQSAVFGHGKSAPAHVPAAVRAPSAPPATAAPSAPAGRTMQDVGHAAFAQGKEQLHRWLNAPLTKTPAPAPTAHSAAPSLPASPSISTPGGKSWADTRQARQDLQERVLKMHRREYIPQRDPVAALKSPTAVDGVQPSPPPGQDPQVMAGMRREFAKKGSLEQLKLSIDVGGSIGIPGMGGLGVSLKDQQERLPGMSRWVPRGAVERGFEYLDKGFDPESVMDTEAERGSLIHPATGAGLAAMGAAKFAPKSGPGGMLLASLGGAGLGTLYHRATNSQRREDGREAFEGAERERSKFPIRRHPTQTANEASPLAVSRGSGDA